MIDVPQINQLHRDMVVRWHDRPIDNPYHGILALVCEQFQFNFRLWHQEDIARSPDAGDAQIAQVKRAIDKLNQQRNDWIEKIDDRVTEFLDQQRVHPVEAAPQNTETLGSVIDRLSILALRIYHLEEQSRREEITDELRESICRKLAVCLEQQDDLSRSLEGLWADILVGHKRHKTYRQFKMYNDPQLNPYLYQARNRTAA